MKQLPHIGNWILSVTNRKRNRETVLGDFKEFYDEIYSEQGAAKAYLWFYGQALKSIPRFLLTSIYWGVVMFNNYMKIAFRNFQRQKLFTFINVFGLAAGIVACMLISLWVQRELSYDNFHEKADRIFRVEREITRDEIDGRWPICSAKYKQALIDDYPEIINAVRFWPRTFSIKDRNNELHRQRLFATDNSVFEIFDFNLIRGNEETALVNPNTIVVTETTAFSYFASTDIIGKTLEFEFDDEYINFEITGVLQDIPQNSHIKFDMLMSFSTYNEDDFTSWRSNYLYTYILTDKNVHRDELEPKLKGFIEQHLEPQYGDLMVQGLTIHQVLKLQLFPLTDIHLNPSENWELEPGGSVESVILFSSIAVILLLIAGINFINLSTARANRRAKEVCLRKTFGAYLQQLRYQFLQESLLLTIISAILAFVFLLFLIPMYNKIFTDNLSAFDLTQSSNFLIFVGIILSIGIIAGLYPAFYLSKFEPAIVIKGGSGKLSKKSFFRKGMVVFQFAISNSLLIGMLVIYLQLNFIQTKSIGFEKENVILLPARSSVVSQNFDLFRSRLLSNNSIVSVSGSGDLPGDPVYSNGNLYNFENTDEHFSSVFMFVDFDFIDTYKIPLMAGRNFSKEYGTDTSGVIILNETAAQKLGFIPNEAVGKVLSRGDNLNLARPIIGVVKDFNFQSLIYQIEPMAFMLAPDYITSISVRVAPGNIDESIAAIKDSWEKSFADEQFEYSFLDQRIESLYENQEKTQVITIIFTIMSVLVACLGLFGLAAFTADERTKEIGIRKTLGANVNNIFVTLTKDYVKWISLSTLISWPISYYLTNNWLDNFAYRIDISLLVFIVPAIVTICITMITISYQTIKSSLLNPVDTLKCE